MPPVTEIVRSKSQRSYLEFAWMFAEAVYKCYLDKKSYEYNTLYLQTRLLNVCAYAHG